MSQRSRSPRPPWKPRRSAPPKRRALPAAALVLAACGAPIEATPIDAARAESDAPPSYAFARDGRVLGVGRAALALPDGRTLIVDDDARLMLGRRALLDHVVGAPALLDSPSGGPMRPDGRAIASRATAPGASDLWIVALDGSAPPRALAAAHGADGQPFVLDDGRVLFVSTRDQVASIYVVDPRGGPATRLTNHTSRPGRLGASFVPPPVRWLEQRGARVTYDAGDATWSIDVDTGAAEVLR